MMVKAKLSGESGIGNQPVNSAAKRNDYRAPKLTVVGTVHDLTLGTGNNGAPDSFYATQQGG
jgi:hypothetical protein